MAKHEINRREFLGFLAGAAAAGIFGSPSEVNAGGEIQPEGNLAYCNRIIETYLRGAREIHPSIRESNPGASLRLDEIPEVQKNYEIFISDRKKHGEARALQLLYMRTSFLLNPGPKKNRSIEKRLSEVFPVMDQAFRDYQNATGDLREEYYHRYMKIFRTYTLLIEESLSPQNLNMRYNQGSACNIFATDFFHVLAEYTKHLAVSHRVSKNSEPVLEGGTEISAKGTVLWIKENMVKEGFIDVTDLSEQEKLAYLKQGYVFYGGSIDESEYGHNYIMFGFDNPSTRETMIILSQATSNITFQLIEKGDPRYYMFTAGYDGYSSDLLFAYKPSIT